MQITLLLNYLISQNLGNWVFWPSCCSWGPQTGVKATGWELDRILKVLWKLFNNSPAIRDLYINLNRLDKFPLKFCQTRWVKDASVASRAIKVWQFIVNVVNDYQSLSKSKHLKNNNSYDLLVKHVTDNLMFIKFQFFKIQV